MTVADRIEWFQSHDSDRPLWVARHEGAVAGWLSFESFYGRPAYHRTAEISVYVSPGYQRRGVGRQLLQSAIAGAPELGLSVLLGFIFGHNQPSLTLFERLGFGRAGTLEQVAELDGVMRDLVIVSRRAGPAA